ncbi:MAG TPA: hypothetical protein VHN18_18535 [Micromonosporaceae bacterium]|nr:hypothetical protein [Micromonosporaceae bacterium]
MERVEELLREEFGRAGGAPPPGRDAMLARVARVRRRRTAGAAGAAMVVVSAMAATVMVTSASPGGDQQAGGTLPDRRYSNELVNVLFTDRTDGYAIQQRCAEDNLVDGVPNGAPTPDVHRECAAHLLVTTDGGRSWQERDLPAEPATKDAGYDLVMGHSLMLWRNTPGSVALGGWDRAYWTTSDGGRTWHESSTPRPVGPAGSIAWFGSQDELTFLATSPPEGFAADGHKYRIGPKNPPTAATDGSFWLACIDAPCVQVTRDGGQTWQRFNPSPSATLIDWVTSYDGHTAYAAMHTGDGPKLARSADGGATWAEVPGLTGLPERSVDGVALANGDLIMTRAGKEGGTFRLRAGTTAVQPMEQAPQYANVLYQTGGVVVSAQVLQQGEQPDLDSVASISTDNGATWRAIPVPAA